MLEKGYLYLKVLKSVGLMSAYFPDFVEHVNLPSDPRDAVSKLLLNSSADQFKFVDTYISWYKQLKIRDWRLETQAEDYLLNL